MQVFISYSHKDKALVEPIVARLREDGHEVWIDSLKLNPGDNIIQKTEAGLQNTDALVVVISENSLHSEWIRNEFSAIALQQISKGDKRIIPIRLDNSTPPSYLSNLLYIDFYQDFASGLERLSETLKPSSLETKRSHHEVTPKPTERQDHQIVKLHDALRQGRLTLVCGAGVSVEAGILAWGDLLVCLMESMMKRISQDHSMPLGEVEAKEFQQRYGGSSLILGKYLKNNLGNDFPIEVRQALYQSQPADSPIIESIVELARPQRDGRPLDSIITFNFDCLIEENLTANNILNKAIFSESIRHDPNELPIYHVHGYLPRHGDIPDETELVFSEDAYHSQFIEQFSWSNLIQLTKLTQSTCLFIGISLTDPNMRRLLDVAWRKNPEKMISHYIVKRLPHFADCDMLDEVAKLLEEQDANALGLNVIWIKDYGELPTLLRNIAVPVGTESIKSEIATPASKPKRQSRKEQK